MSQPRRRPGHRGLSYRVITRNLHQMIGLLLFLYRGSLVRSHAIVSARFPLTHSVETNARSDVGCQLSRIRYAAAMSKRRGKNLLYKCLITYKLPDQGARTFAHAVFNLSAGGK